MANSQEGVERSAKIGRKRERCIQSDWKKGEQRKALFGIITLNSATLTSCAV